MAHLLGFASFKGGTGKTTLAYAMAERSYSPGLRTLLLDFDPQETACGIAYLREQPGWEVRRCQVSVAGAEELNNIADSGDYDFVVGDLPEARSCPPACAGQYGPGPMPRCDGAPDLSRGQQFRVDRQENVLARGVRWQQSSPGRRRRLELTQELEALELPVCSAFVQTRVAHLDAMSRGQSACEWAPSSTAALELQALWEWIAREMGITAGEIEEKIEAL